MTIKMTTPIKPLIEIIGHKYPPIENYKYVYGTAGFRMDASLLDSIAFKVTILAILRSFSHNGSTVGMMITASHNPPNDNGIKVVEPFGEMLDPNWEGIATEIANTNGIKLIDLINSIWYKYYKDGLIANVIIGMDTRESGPHLTSIVIEVLKSLDGFVKFVNLGQVTTPQLHFITRCYNDSKFGDSPSIFGYHKKLGDTFLKIIKLNKFLNLPDVVIDGANGIGSIQMNEFLNFNKELKWNVDVVNSNVIDPSSLNVNCGADYVKTNQKEPIGSKLNGKLGASFDGDADRIVFYFTNENGEFHLLDGDRIAILLADFIYGLVSKLNVDNIDIGIVQTAYANGASTDYITKELKLPVVCTNTGVKHLHHAATKFDIGVYFEANGHGTVLFKPEFIKRLKTFENSNARDTLLLLSDLINQTVGDSMSDLLAVIVALTYLKMTPSNWFKMYQDLPNKLYKVLVKDRFMFKTTDAERKLVEPVGIQGKIDSIVKAIDGKNGRSFVRASGTEDAVRVYSEATSSVLCEEIGNSVVSEIEKI